MGRLSVGDLGVICEALTVLAAVSLLTRVTPFRTYVELGSIRLPHKQSPEAARIAKIVDIVADRVPFRAVCLQRGLALQWMLRRRGVDALLHYGIKIGLNDLEAHVWVSVSGTVVIGAPQHVGFTEVTKYPSQVPKALA